MSVQGQKNWEACVRAMLVAAREWRKTHKEPLEFMLPPEDTWIVAALCDETIPILASNEAARLLLKHVEAIAEPLGGASFMQGVDVLRAIAREIASS